MRAVLVRAFGEPSVMRVEEAPAPRAQDGQILVRLHAAGVNPVDAYIRSGRYSRVPELPYIPGMDGAGVVESIGPRVTPQPGSRALCEGDRVWLCARAGGAYAELVACEPHEVHPLPDGVPFEQGACLGVPFLTAWRALMQVGLARPGQAVLVHGASGGVGSACVQIAAAMGMEVLGTAGTPEGLAFVRSLGCTHAFHHGETGYEKAIIEATGGRGVDVVVEMLANVNLARDMDLIAPRGRIVVVGNRGETIVNPRGLMAKDATVAGMALFNAAPAELLECAAGIGAGLREGWLRPTVQEVIPLEHAPRAHDWVMTDGKRGNIVLRL